MEIKLNSLKIRNFKGLKDYELEANGKDLNIQGDNATGKTTIYDAFLWVLFGKNSEDQAAFDWKPLDEYGDEINHLETEVIAEIEVDGQAKKLSRMTEEDWRKKRGSAREVFSGHTTTYKIDDLTVKKKEYDAQLAELIDEGLFKLLTNVSYFPEKLKWQERRQALIDMVGDITDADVIAKNDELSPLKPLIEERPAEDLKKLTEQEKRQVNKDINTLPDRIDEVDRSLPDISDLNKKDLIDQQEQHNKKIEKLQEEIAEIKNSNEVVKVKNKIAELRTNYKEMKLEHEEELEKELEDTLHDKDSLETEIREYSKTTKRIEDEISANERILKRVEQEITNLETDREKLLEQFYEIRNEQMPGFEAHRTTCPTCGQDLPEDQLLKIRNDYEKEVETFNTEKAQELEANKERGQGIANKIKDSEKKIEQLINSIQEDTEILEKNQKEKKQLQSKLETIEMEEQNIRNGQNPFSKTETAKKITKNGEKLQEQIDSGQSNIEVDIERVNSQIKSVREELEAVNEKLSEIDFHARQSKRKTELIEQEQTLSVKYGELEQRLHLLEEFTRTKVNLLTDTINDRFDLVKFKLFEEQINGGLTETCEVTVEGANYSSGLNNAMKINAGLDIINTLMDYYDTYVPVFIDNAESVNDLLEIDTQLITLSVSNHKNLRVKVAS